jgi:hypothetical protein
MKRVFFIIALSLGALPAAASAEELWVISTGDDFAYFIDADSIVAVPGDIKKAIVHQIFFPPRDVGLEVPVRVIKVEYDFDCVTSTYQQLSVIGLDDEMNQISASNPSDPEALEPGTNVAMASAFACAEADAHDQFAQKLSGNASLEEALRILREMEKPEGP